MRRARWLAVGLGLLGVTTAPGQVPTRLRFQGRLAQVPGVSLPGSLDLTLRLWTDPSSGSAVHVETDSVDLDANGRFATTLGDGAPLQLADFSQALWVGITPDEGGGGSELSPRVALAAAPAALRAGFSEAITNFGAGPPDLGGGRLRRLGAPVGPQDAARAAYIGELADLQTSTQGSLVEAVNELHGKLGDLASLETAAQGDLVVALNELTAEVEALEAKTAALSVSGDGLQVYVTGASLHVRNASGVAHGSEDGLGNLIVGYDEDPGGDADRGGSHNLVLGEDREYPGSGDLVGNSAPVVSAVSASGAGGDVTVQFDLADAEGDLVDVEVTYRGGSSGETYRLATITESTTGLTPGAGLTLTWQSGQDELYQVASDYQVRIRPRDAADIGDAAASSTFALDNDP